MLCSLFLLIPRCLNFMYRRFGYTVPSSQVVTMTVTTPIFTEFNCSSIFVKNSYTEFHANPTYGLVADTMCQMDGLTDERARSPHNTLYFTWFRTPKHASKWRTSGSGTLQTAFHQVLAFQIDVPCPSGFRAVPRTRSVLQARSTFVTFTNKRCKRNPSGRVPPAQ